MKTMGHGQPFCQQGFALLELAVAGAITCMLVIWAANTLVREVEDSADRGDGRWMLEIRRALDGMVAQHFVSLADNEVLVNEQGQRIYADPWSPTLEELKTQGHLPVAFPLVGTHGRQAKIQILRGTSCPGHACRLDALVYVRPTGVGAGAGHASFGRIATMVMAMEGSGGSVSELTPTRLRGAAFDFPNPPVPGMAALPVGTVVAWTGLGASVGGRYLQWRDRRDPAFQGNVSAQGTLTAAGRLVAGEYLKLNRIAVAGNRCPEEGLLARDERGSLLNCVDGHWSMPGNFGGAFGMLQNWCRSSGKLWWKSPELWQRWNPLTGKCSCPPGFVAVQVGGSEVTLHEVHTVRGYVCLRPSLPYLID